VRHSAHYIEAYCRQKMLDTELRGLDPQRRIDVQALVKRARARIHAEGKVVPWPRAVGAVERRPAMALAGADSGTESESESESDSWNPYHVVKKLRAKGWVQDAPYIAIRKRTLEIGATDMDDE
jgi:hypothetical protein